MPQRHFLSKDHGQPDFSAERAPVLTVAPGRGDRITFETEDEAYRQLHEYRDMAKLTATLNPITGPVHIEGAEPGDVLAVHIHDISFGDVGWSMYLPGAGALAGAMGEEWMTRRINLDAGTAHLGEGISCPVAPMIGCLGVAPAEGTMSTMMPSYPTGGNMDLTDAAPGSTVYLPVQVPGALLSIGDLHAVMARGESTFVAIEAAVQATVSVDLLSAPGGSLASLRAPRILTPQDLVCVGLGDPLHESVTMAQESMFRALTQDHGYSASDAYVLMSAAAHSELGGPTGSKEPDPLHPFRAVGAVTLARLSREFLGE